MKKKTLLVLLPVFLLAACSNSNNDNSGFKQGEKISETSWKKAQSTIDSMKNAKKKTKKSSPSGMIKTYDENETIDVFNVDYKFKGTTEISDNVKANITLNLHEEKNGTELYMSGEGSCDGTDDISKSANAFLKAILGDTYFKITESTFEEYTSMKTYLNFLLFTTGATDFKVSLEEEDAKKFIVYKDTNISFSDSVTVGIDFSMLESMFGDERREEFEYDAEKKAFVAKTLTYTDTVEVLEQKQTIKCEMKDVSIKVNSSGKLTSVYIGETKEYLNDILVSEIEYANLDIKYTTNFKLPEESVCLNMVDDIQSIQDILTKYINFPVYN